MSSLGYSTAETTQIIAWRCYQYGEMFVLYHCIIGLQTVCFLECCVNTKRSID